MNENERAKEVDTDKVAVLDSVKSVESPLVLLCESVVVGTVDNVEEGSVTVEVRGSERMEETVVEPGALPVVVV